MLWHSGAGSVRDNFGTNRQHKLHCCFTMEMRWLRTCQDRHMVILVLILVWHLDNTSYLDPLIFNLVNLKYLGSLHTPLRYVFLNLKSKYDSLVHISVKIPVIQWGTQKWPDLNLGIFWTKLPYFGLYCPFFQYKVFSFLLCFFYSLFPSLLALKTDNQCRCDHFLGFF